MALMDLFKKKAAQLDKEVIAGIPVFRGHDPNKAFANRTVSQLAEAEGWFHGGTLPGQKDWFLLNKEQINRPATEIISQIVEQERVSKVLITSCNIGQTVVRTPKGATVTYGLGYGLHTDRVREGLSPVKAWGEGIVVSEGETARIFTKSALQAEMERRGMDVSSLSTFKQRGLRGEALGESTAIGTFLDPSGKQRITLNAAAQSTEEVMKFSLPIEEAPSLTAAFGRDISFSAAGKSFGSLEEASTALAGSLKSRSKTAAAASSFLERAGIAPRPLSVAVAGEHVAVEGIEAAAGRQFKPSSYAGILLAGVLAIGGSFVMKGWKTLNASIDDNQQQQNQPHGYNIPPSHNAPLHGGQEHFSIRKTFAASPEGTTKITLDDAQLDHAAVDRSFSAHMRGGLAYGRRSS